MAKTVRRADAPGQIDTYIASLPAWSKAICERLREIILESDPKIIEDWKGGPNYYKNGMICGFAAFSRHVNFVFFKGVAMKDRKKLFEPDDGNVQTRRIRLTDIKQIDESIVLEYLMEAIDNNIKGVKIAVKDKAVEIPADVKKAFRTEGVLKYFESCAYSHRKEWIRWIESAKKKETRVSRIERAAEKLCEKSGIRR